MRRKTIVLTVLLLMVGLFAAMGVAAQTEYDSTINIRNMDSETANVVIQFYDQNGVHAPSADVNLQIPGQSMAFYFVLSNTFLADDFQGSAVVASDRELVIIHNLRLNVGEQGASTNGFQDGSSVVQLPLLMRNNGGYTTWFSVQNAGMNAATVEVEFFAGLAGNDWQWTDGTDNFVTIEPGAAYYFDQADMPDLGSTFVGSAIVTSTNAQPLVASVVQAGPFGLFAYDGFGTGGSQTIMAPLFQYFNAGYQSSIQIQNVGNAATDVTVSYVPGMAGNACTETHTINPGASETFGFMAFSGPTGASDCNAQNPGTSFIGSAVVTTNSGSQPLLGVVNQMNMATTRSGSYNAYDADAGTQCVALPLLMDRNSGYWTSLNVMNIGASQTTVTVEYSEYNGVTPPNAVVVLDPNEMDSILHLNQLADPYIGSAMACGGAGAEIVAMVNQINTLVPGGSDTLYVYNGFNVPN